jgi:hypothetical protein
MMNTEPAMFQRICAAPDAVGNPRRLYTIYGTDGSLLTSIDYEHFGQPRWFDDLVELPSVSVSVSVSVASTGFDGGHQAWRNIDGGTEEVSGGAAGALDQDDVGSPSGPGDPFWRVPADR